MYLVLPAMSAICLFVILEGTKLTCWSCPRSILGSALLSLWVIFPPGPLTMVLNAKYVFVEFLATIPERSILDP